MAAVAGTTVASVDEGYTLDGVFVVLLGGTSVAGLPEAGTYDGVYRLLLDGTSVGAVGSFSSAGTLESLSPAPGEISADAETARWTPIVAVISVDGNQSSYVFASIGAMRWMIYAAGEFMPMFAERSSVVFDGTNYTFTILPNGGWWRTPIDIRFLEANELA